MLQSIFSILLDVRSVGKRLLYKYFWALNLNIHDRKFILKVSYLLPRKNCILKFGWCMTSSLTSLLLTFSNKLKRLQDLYINFIKFLSIFSYRLGTNNETIKTLTFLHSIYVFRLNSCLVCRICICKHKTEILWLRTEVLDGPYQSNMCSRHQTSQLYP